MPKPKSKIEVLRRTNFLTQAEVASHLGMTAANYSKLENQQRRMTMDVALKLKRIFKVEHLEDLLDSEIIQAS